MTTPLGDWKAAIERGDTEAVRALFTRYPELSDQVNAKIFAFDSTAIFCGRNNVELVDILLEHGADINEKTGWEAGGFGILEDLPFAMAQPLIERGAVVDIWAAVSLNDKEQAVELLQQDPKLIISRGGDGKHPLHYARDIEMVDLLVSHGGIVDARCIDHGSTPLQYLIENHDVVFRLLEHGARPDIFMAAYWGATVQANQCITAAPDCCNARLGSGVWTHHGMGDIYKWTIGHDATPLQVARRRQHPNFVDFILRHASPKTILTDAIWNGDRAAVDKVCRLNVDVVSQLIANDSAAMSRAAWEYNFPAVATMLDLGFDPHKVGVHDSSPLDRAAFHGYADIIDLLLRHDPDPPIHGKNEFGGTPVEACLHGLRHGWKTGHPQDHVESVRLLIEAGSTVSERLLGHGNSMTDQLIKQRLARS